MTQDQDTEHGGAVRAAIRERRSIFSFEPEPVARELLMSLLDAGIWAPNHKLTEPWRFIIVGPQTQRALAERYGELQAEKRGDRATADDARQAGIEKLMSKPTIVAVAHIKDGDAMRQQEDYAATCCAIQNIQLAAWEAGIGVQWSTGAVTRDAEAARLLGLDPVAEACDGFLYMGRPAAVPRSRRKHVEDVTRVTP